MRNIDVQLSCTLHGLALASIAIKMYDCFIRTTGWSGRSRWWLIRLSLALATMIASACMPCGMYRCHVYNRFSPATTDQSDWFRPARELPSESNGRFFYGSNERFILSFPMSIEMLADMHVGVRCSCAVLVQVKFNCTHHMASEGCLSQ